MNMTLPHSENSKPYRSYVSSKSSDYWKAFEDVTSIMQAMVHGKDFQPSMIELLEKTGRFLGAGRAYLFSYDTHTNTVSCISEWTASEVPPQKSRLQNVEITPYTWGLEQMEKLESAGEIFLFSTSAFSRLAKKDAESMKSLLAPDTKSLIVAKVGSKTTLGYIAFSFIERTKEGLQREEIELLAHVKNLAECALSFNATKDQAYKRGRRLETIVNNANLLVCCFDKDGKFTYVNDAYCEYFGIKKDEILGINAFNIIRNEKVRQQVIANFLSLTLSNPTITHEYRMRLKDGSLRWHKWIDTALFDEQGNVLEYQSVGVDITEQIITQQNLISTLEKLHRTYKRTIEAMGKILEIKDPYTASHQKKVALISESIAKEMGLGKEETEQIYLGALVHDIGKIYIPSELLSKPGKLSELEFQLIKDHTTKGEEILRPISEDLPIWEVALYHHERMNGSGYPHGLKGKDIPLSARIVAVADVVDAMSSHRPYRAAFSIEHAIEELKQNAGTKYDPEVVKIFIKLFEEGRLPL